MDHVAIMKKSWGMTEKIARGEKTIESRWLKHRTSPWNKVAPGDRVFFKDSGEPVCVETAVDHVLYLEHADGDAVLRKYGNNICISDVPQHTNFVVLIFLKDVRQIPPFSINKKGFGAMAAWITVDSIEEIRL